MKTIATALTLFVLAAFSPAPVFSNNAPRGITPEQTQDQRAAQQYLQQTQSVVGSVPEVRTEGIALHAGGEGADLVRNSQSQISKSSSLGNTKEVLTVAESDVARSGRSPFTKLIGMFLIVGIGYGCFQAFKWWAAKNVPAPKQKIPVKW